MNWKDYLENVEADMVDLRDDLDALIDSVQALIRGCEEIADDLIHRGQNLDASDVAFDIDCLRFIGTHARNRWITSLRNAEEAFNDDHPTK